MGSKVVSRLAAIVLGAAAGGGFPQWNCRCAVCRLAWAGDKRVKPRTQASLAVSADGAHWVLLNASPDLRAQIQANQKLQPRGQAHDNARGSPIAAVVLTGAEIDQTAGLLSLRERSPFALYATAATLAAIADNPMFAALAADVVARRAVVPGKRFALGHGLEAELFIVPGKVPLYLEGDDPDTASESAANVGVEIFCAASRLAFVPGAAAITPAVMQRLARADVIFFDGTLFADDEMIATGTGTKTGRRMGHMPLDGPDGSLAALAGLRARRIFVHINNTNPILVDGSPERGRVVAAGWEVAEDGLEIKL
jgi:pyrroloquinoline quinone biosynthesis protein B